MIGPLSLQFPETFIYKGVDELGVGSEGTLFEILERFTKSTYGLRQRRALAQK